MINTDLNTQNLGKGWVPMTAVNPTRLRHQIQELIAFFDAPLEFHQALRTLFSLYANYSLRFGESASIRPLILMYHLPHPVMRQLNFDLQPRIDSRPGCSPGTGR
jgi:hypothetical protein